MGAVVVSDEAPCEVCGKPTSDRVDGRPYCGCAEPCPWCGAPPGRACEPQSTETLHRDLASALTRFEQQEAALQAQRRAINAAVAAIRELASEHSADLYGVIQATLSGETESSLRARFAATVRDHLREHRGLTTDDAVDRDTLAEVVLNAFDEAAGR